MRVGFYHTDKKLCRDEIVFGYRSPMRMDDTNKRLGDLSQRCAQIGIQLNCIQSVEAVEWLDAILIADIDPLKDAVSRKILASPSLKILLLEECDVIRPDLWEEELWRSVDHVLTWDDVLSLRDGFTHTNFSDAREYQGGEHFSNRKHACLIAANKTVSHIDELYSERLGVVRWYEQNDLENFCLYGFGWDEMALPLHSSIFSKLNGKKTTFIRKALASKRPSWQGTVERKIDVLKKFKFCFCFENAKNRNGYILEKIFDPMYAGCIPIYWGAQNIHDYIPRETFIDFRAFDSLQDCNNFLHQLDQHSFEDYVQNIQRFLASAGKGYFSTSNFVNAVIGVLTSNEGPQRETKLLL